MIYDQRRIIVSLDYPCDNSCMKQLKQNSPINQIYGKKSPNWSSFEFKIWIEETGGK